MIIKAMTREEFEMHKKVIAGSLLFRNFSEEEVWECLLRASSKVIDLDKNESLKMPEKLSDIYMALSGQFHVIQDSGMNNSFVHLLAPGRCFGIAFCAEQISCPDTLQASEKGKLLRLSYRGLLAKEDSRFRLMENLLGITSVNLQLLAEKINHTQSRSVRVKLSVFLRDHVEYSGSDSFTMKMGRKDMADYLNITYPAMLRELSRMQKEGILRIDGDRITILDLQTLVELGSEYTIL